MITEAQIQDHLFQYLTREISLNEFEDWLVVQSWDMHQDSSEGAPRLVGAIELRLAEYTAGHLTDDGFERELKGLTGLPVSFAIDAAQNAVPIKPTWTSNTVSESSFLEVALPVAA